MMLPSVLLLVAQQLVTPAAADNVPALNIEPLCQGIAQQGGSSFHDSEIGKAKQDCLKTENEVRDELVKQWSTFAPPDKTACTNESRMGGDSSYTELLTCLEMARDVRAMHNDKSNAPNTAATPEAPVSTRPK